MVGIFQYVIQYDFSGFTSRTEAEDMINVLRDAALRGMSILRDKKAQDFANGVWAWLPKISWTD